MEIAEKMADTLEMSLDELVYGQQNEKARVRIADNELLNLFKKTQDLPDDQKNTEIVTSFFEKNIIFLNLKY